MRTHEPNMNIVNQINAGLNDVRKSLIAGNFERADFEYSAIKWMIRQHEDGLSVPWSDRRPAIEEEFS